MGQPEAHVSLTPACRMGSGTLAYMIIALRCTVMTLYVFHGTRIAYFGCCDPLCQQHIINQIHVYRFYFKQILSKIPDKFL